MLVRAICAAAFSVVVATSASAVQCAKRDGLLPDPVVPTADAAKAIYSAIARSSPRLHKLEGPGPITVIDEGSQWGVTHYVDPKVSLRPDHTETVKMVGGGGDLAMTINKCTGTIEMSLNR